jgi:diguanylate cyclase (GGDEF)-like protein
MPFGLGGFEGSARGGLARYRDRIFYGLAGTAAAALLPFSVNNFLQGRTALGVVTAAMVLGFAANALAIYRGRPAPLPIWLVFLPGLLALPLAVRSQGVIGVLWTYPAMVLFHFVLDRRAANLLNISVAALVTGMAAQALPRELTLRVGVTLFLTILFSNIFSAILAGLQRQLQEQAIRDPLTGAFNRRHMDGCLADAVERQQRHGAAAALLVLDLDHFKRINDEHGHAAGDRVLTETVGALRSRLRKLDLLFRSGGEEFVVLLPETDAAGAALLGDALRGAVTAISPGAGRPVTLSAGVAALLPGEDADGWLRRADRALYEAKHAGRDRVVVAEG